MRRLLLLAALAAVACGARAPKEETMAQVRERVFAVAQAQAVYMDSLLPEGRCPRNFQDGKLVTSDIGWWCSGFYPGVLWQIYGETADTLFRQLAVKHTLPLAGLLEQNTDHDIGFQLMSSFGRWFWIDFFDPREEDVLPPLEIKGILEKGAGKLVRLEFDSDFLAHFYKLFDLSDYSSSRGRYPLFSTMVLARVAGTSA